MNDHTRAPRDRLVVATTTAALVAVFIAAAYAHSRTMNTDLGRFDQDLYLAGARELRESAYAASTNRINMPAYLYFQSAFYDPEATIEANFARGKWANVALSVAVLGALAARFLMARDTRTAQRRFESLFRRPEKPPRPPASGHYYKRYWE